MSLDFGNVEGLKIFLESLTLEEAPGLVQHIVYPWVEYSRQPAKDLSFWYSESTIPYTTVRNLILRRLAQVRHPTSDRLADTVLLLFLLIPGRRDSLLTFERLLNTFVHGTVAQYVILPASPLLNLFTKEAAEELVIGYYEHGPFRYEPLALELWTNIQYWLARVGFESMASKLRTHHGRITLVRQPRPITVIDLNQMGFRATQTADIASVLQYYFDDMAAACFEQFWGEHLESQYLSTAAGADLLERTTLEALPGTAWFSLFHGFDVLSARGMVSLITEESHHTNSLALKIYMVGEDLSKAHARIQRELGSLAFQGFHYPSLVNFTRIMTRSRQLRNLGYIEESFLLLTVALETVLAERDSITEKLSRRAAAVLATSESAKFQDSVRLIRDLYNLRSKFVHVGEGIPSTSLDKLQNVASSVFFAAFRSQARSAMNGKDEATWRREWLRVLDYAAASFEADIAVDRAAKEIAGARQTAT